MGEAVAGAAAMRSVEKEGLEGSGCGTCGERGRLATDKIRQENRERKKRWRQANEDRNKDNDLRCRVNKRAHKLYGKEQSLAKSKWIETEFLKRQMKRKDRERKRSLELCRVSSSGHDSGFSTGFNAVEFSQTFLAHLSQNLVAFNHPIPFSLRSALVSFSTNSNFLKIISTLFSSLTNNNVSPPPSSETAVDVSEDASLPVDYTTTQLYQSLLSNLFPNHHELSALLASETSDHLKNSQETMHNDCSAQKDTYSPSAASQSSITTSTLSSISAPSINYKLYDPVSAMGFPPMPIDFKDQE
ncbi:hypothetical protein PORY_000201 [Pneumocystis oryctolagi]|uniref:Uncharacterized protein n=1 Tax=Pneumocystis oryctolagi TaxID=42067 RepID=A0ACB7CGI4_9ASCO|nr:hypothetical protein PORY_000201 [Pneumocystis oryctolagi]